MGKIKHLYRGAFNYAREVHVLRAYAYTEKQAWLVFCRRLAKKHGVDPGLVMSMFDGRGCAIEKEIEYTEEEP